MGRPRLIEGSVGPMRTLSVRLPVEEIAGFKLLGGRNWLREKLYEALSSRVSATKQHRGKDGNDREDGKGEGEGML